MRRFVKNTRPWALIGILWISASLTALEIQPLTGESGMVVAGHPEAAEIGRDVLCKGGNAMDAVVATSFALGVAEPYGSGIGGKCAIMYFEAKTGKTWFVDGLDASRADIDAEAFAALPGEARYEGAQGAGIPGWADPRRTNHAAGF